MSKLPVVCLCAVSLLSGCVPMNAPKPDASRLNASHLNYKTIEFNGLVIHYRDLTILAKHPLLLPGFTIKTQGHQIENADMPISDQMFEPASSPTTIKSKRIRIHRRLKQDKESNV